ncbi:MAG: magnesium transporter [Candidatus Bipolaricaulia bacterium]
MKLEELKERHPAEIAAELEDLPEEEVLQILHRLPRELASDVLEQLRPRLSARLVSHLDRDEASDLLEEMEPDDAVDVIERLPQEEQEELLGRMEAEEAAVLEELRAYPSDTAGGIMSPEVVALSQGMTVEEATAELRRVAGEAETIYYAYVVDEERRLLGVLSMRDLALSPPWRRLSEIMITDLLKVDVATDKEEVARLFDRYNYLALPVVDSENRLLGIVTVDDVIDVMRQEATEDMHRLVGVAREERVFSPIGSSLRRRLPWLSSRGRSPR